MRKIYCAVLTAVIISLLAGLPVVAFADESGNRQLNDTNENFRVVGYYCGDVFDDPVEAVQIDKLTHLIYGFLIPTEEGGLITIEKQDKLNEIVSFSHAAGTKVFIAVGGYSYKNVPLKDVFQSIGANEELREKFTNNILEFVIKNNLDGVDLDWEYPRYAVAADYEDDTQNAYCDYVKTEPLESYYNGLNTLRDKTLLALSKCGGVMIFDINEDVDWQDEKLGKYSAISMIDDVVGRLSGLTRGVTEYFVTIIIDNEELLFSEEDGMGMPFIDAASRTDVPLRKPLEKIGAEVSYDGKTKILTAVRGDITVQVPINKKYIIVNGESRAIDSGAVIIQGRTYLPIRAVMEAFGYTVEWNQTSKTVYIGD